VSWRRRSCEAAGIAVPGPGPAGGAAYDHAVSDSTFDSQVAPSTEPQDVLSPLTEAAIFLVLTVGTGGEGATRDLLADLPGLQRSIGFRAPAARLSCVTGIGSDLWDRLFDGPRPEHLHPFVPLEGDRHTAPSTPGDLLFHLRSARMDLCFAMAAKITEALAGLATVVDEVHGFVYFDQRDLLGFVDGTENPVGDDARRAALIAEGGRWDGGSYVVVQKYRHDLAAWNALSVEEQERAVGRTKLDNMELGDDEKPANSHLALNVIEDENGEELQILRDNMPFGNVRDAEYGTYYIAYAADPGVTERMLRNMFIGDPPGTTDRLLDFSTATTGGLFFVPPAGMLESQPAAAGSAAEPEVEPTVVTDGSLGIGSLKRSTR
jgi:putative iron-dependent peroxidase